MQERREAARVRWPLLGEHNVMNALAAIAAAHQRRRGAPGGRPKRFGMVPRASNDRMEDPRGVIGGVTVYDDFAHHPTAIATTLAGLRAAREPQCPDHRRARAPILTR